MKLSHLITGMILQLIWSIPKELLNNLSDYNNAHKLERKRTAFTAYLKEIISSIQPTYQYLGITLKTDISPSLPALFIDPVKIKAGFTEICSENAAEANFQC